MLLFGAAAWRHRQVSKMFSYLVLGIDRFPALWDRA